MPILRSGDIPGSICVCDANGKFYPMVTECDTETGRIVQYRAIDGVVVIDPVMGGMVEEEIYVPAPLILTDDPTFDTPIFVRAEA